MDRIASSPSDGFTMPPRNDRKNFRRDLRYRMGNQYYVYFMTNTGNNVIYVGVTNDLKRRVYEHKEKLVEGFTKQYNVNKLVHYDIFDDIENAIAREKQIKGGSRQKKIEIINKNNKDWVDLYESQIKHG